MRVARGLTFFLGSTAGGIFTYFVQEVITGGHSAPNQATLTLGVGLFYLAGSYLGQRMFPAPVKRWLTNLVSLFSCIVWAWACKHLSWKFVYYAALTFFVQLSLLSPILRFSNRKYNYDYYLGMLCGSVGVPILTTVFFKGKTGTNWYLTLVMILGLSLAQIVYGKNLHYPPRQKFYPSKKGAFSDVKLSDFLADSLFGASWVLGILSFWAILNYKNVYSTYWRGVFQGLLVLASLISLKTRVPLLARKKIARAHSAIAAAFFIAFFAVTDNTTLAAAFFACYAFESMGLFIARVNLATLGGSLPFGLGGFFVLLWIIKDGVSLGSAQGAVWTAVLSLTSGLLQLGLLKLRVVKNDSTARVF